MHKKTINVISLLTTILLLLYLMNSAYARGNPHGKGDKGKHKGWSKGKKLGHTKEKSNKGKHKGWTKGKRVGQKSTTPPGWKKGLKKGWDKSTPPGWNKWNKKTKEKWGKDLANVKGQINAKAKRKGWDTKDCERATIAFEFAAREGIPVGHVRKIIEGCIDNDLKGEETLEVSTALSEGVGKGANFETLGSRVVKKLKAGYRGKKLASEIHIMIEARHKAKMESKGKGKEKNK